MSPVLFTTKFLQLLRNVQMSNAENGARIKAFAGPNVGSGIVKNITFSHFKETNVDNPLIIDQVSRINFMSSIVFK